MGKVFLDMAMSLDGFIAGPNHEDGRLHDWYFTPSHGATDRNREVIDALVQTIGAMVVGRRTYNMGDQHDGFVDSPYHVPHFVLSHTLPPREAKGETKFVFVADGIESALAQARAAAGNKDVCVSGGTHTAQQYLQAGLLDEIQLHLVPVLLGAGVRLFDQFGPAPIDLENIGVIEGTGVTHLQFRVMK